MKKFLAVILAVLTLFSVLGVGATAINDTYYSDYYASGVIGKDQVILTFDLNGGTLKVPTAIYDTTLGNFVIKDGSEITGIYVKLPQDKSTQNVGQYTSLPHVNPPAGSAFLGWYCYEDGVTYAPSHNYKIPAGKEGNVVHFYAYYAPAEAEEDTFGTILGILIKVFGAIAGILLYNGNTEQGIALFDKILGALDF